MTRPVEPPRASDFESAKDAYVERYGGVVVMNTYLKIAVGCLSVSLAGLTAVHLRTLKLFEDFRPLVIRINDVGRAEAVTYTDLRYSPQEAEIKYFLVRFIEKHFSRIRATVRNEFAESLYFLDGPTANSLIEANGKSKAIEEFLIDQSDEVEAHVKSVTLVDLRKSPYRATVEFEKVYLSAGDRTERKRERYTAHFVFSFRDHVPNELIPINPLGFSISYFRADQAF